MDGWMDKNIYECGWALTFYNKKNKIKSHKKDVNTFMVVGSYG